MKFARVWVLWQTKGRLRPVCAFASHEKAIIAASQMTVGDEYPDDYISELAYDTDEGAYE